MKRVSLPCFFDPLSALVLWVGGWVYVCGGGGVCVCVVSVSLRAVKCQASIVLVIEVPFPPPVYQNSHQIRLHTG